MSAARTHPDAPEAPFLEFVERSLTPDARPFLIERHRPTRFLEPYHHHVSVEINFLDDVDMTYSFSGRAVSLPRRRLTLFWAAAPHRVVEVAGAGEITNVYLSLAQVLRWSLPAALIADIAAGCVVAARSGAGDAAWLDRLIAERDRSDPEWLRLHLSEIEARLRRVGLEGWDRLLAPPDGPRAAPGASRAMRHAETMIRFVADNYTRAIGVAEVAAAANLSPGHAMTSFRAVMGASIGDHLTRTRLSHACMLLAETRAKIVTVAMDSGFASVSSFYAAFRAELGMSPARFRRDAGAGRGETAPPPTR